MANKKTGTVIEMVENTSIGENVAYRIEGKKLVIEVDLTTELGLSASGKTMLVSKSGGVDSKFKWGSKEYTINCNVYKK